MIKHIPNLLVKEQVDQLRSLVAKAKFVDGRISNPHSKVKQNLHLGDMCAYEQTSKTLREALIRDEDFVSFAQPQTIAPPLITKYGPGMRYGLHPDAPTISIPSGTFRSDLSCTIFLNDASNYEGGALRITLGDSQMRFKGPAGSAVVYPSTTLHEVETVTAGERLVAISFIQSRIRDTDLRFLYYELGEVAALEGLGMRPENHARLQNVRNNLGRMWLDY